MKTIIYIGTFLLIALLAMFYTYFFIKIENKDIEIFDDPKAYDTFSAFASVMLVQMELIWAIFYWQYGLGDYLIKLF